MAMRVVSEAHFFCPGANAHIQLPAIQAPLHPPQPHPHDRPLLRPLSTLGKPKFSDSGVSFLRRTEYISSYTSKSRFESTTSRSLIDNTGNRTKRAPGSIDKESPEYIKNQAEKSFQIAANYLKNPTQIRHPNPSKRNVKLLNANPLLPDLDSFPDAGGYVTIKFMTNPVPPSTTYDIRLENSLLKPMDVTEEEEAAKAAAAELYNKDPERYPPPDNTIEYEFFMTETPSEALDPEKDSEEIYTQKNGAGDGCIRFKRVRAYESAFATGSAAEKYEEVIIAVHDGKDGLRQKGAYYYPIVQKSGIRPQRQKNIDKRRRFAQEEPKRQTDFLDMRVDEPFEDLKGQREVYRTEPFGREVEEEAEDAGHADGTTEQRNDAESQ
jgi:RNA polymerase II-associated factor 1